MKKIILLNKKEGETPLEALGRFRLWHKEYNNISMTYAGRLDPMASGALIILAGEEAKNKEKYLALPKEYNFKVLFGLATDTYDILGKITNPRASLGLKEGRDLEREIKRNLKYFKGKFKQKYPPYSSRTVLGKSLFTYAREGVQVQIPEKEIMVKSFKFLKLRKISSKNLLNNIEKRIKRVYGDFRQKEILKIWENKLSKNQLQYFVGSFQIKCSSGTYVRGIANSLGEKVGVPALAFGIKRTKIGKWSIK